MRDTRHEIRKIAIIFCLASLVSCLAPAADCLKYKRLPSLEIKVPGFSVSVVQPERGLDLLHGNVVATLAEEYEIEYGAEKASTGGWCVFIERVSATIGYTNFVIQIDKRHEKDSCEFNAIKEHEDEHVRAHLSVIEDGKKDIKQGLIDAADSVLPVFAETEKDFDRAMEEMEGELEARPEVKLLRQKLAAEQEIRNKKIDLGDKGRRIRACEN